MSCILIRILITRLMPNLTYFDTIFDTLPQKADHEPAITTSGANTSRREGVWKRVRAIHAETAARVKLKGRHMARMRGESTKHAGSVPCDTAMTTRERLEERETSRCRPRGCESDVSYVAGCGQAGTRYHETRGWARDWALCCAYNA
jgi:hypothetical protein